MSLWTTPADPNLDLFPGVTSEEIGRILESIDIDEIREDMRNDREFQKRLRAFGPRKMSVEEMLKIY